MSTALLSVQGLQLRIGERQVCQDLSFAAHAGEVWGILGCNGSGKTTLLHCLAGLIAPQAGEIHLLGRDISRMQRRETAQWLGVLFQQQQESFPATVLETALTGRHPFLRAWQWETPADIALTKQALAELELDRLEKRAINTLSGGELQRLRIATLLSQDPLLSLLDEPTNHLDLHYQIKLLRLLCKRNRGKQGLILMALHDLNLAARFCTHILLLAPDQQLSHGPVAELMQADKLSSAFGCPILRLQSEQGVLFIPQ